MTDIDPVPALQAALQGENAAVFGYGQAAGALGGEELARARRDLDAHRSRRDRLRSLLIDASATPSPAAPEYVVPPTPNASAARAVLADIESSLTAVYGDVVATSTGSALALGITAMTESAVRSARWGATVPAFPGMPERATPTASTTTPPPSTSTTP